jgi:hypothetical protein
MGVQARRARERRKSFKKMMRRFMLTCVGLVAITWSILHYSEIAGFVNRLIIIPIETIEIDDFYDSLSRHKQSHKNLMFDLDIEETDNIEAIMKKLQHAMGLKNASIKLAYHDKKMPPGYINAKGDKMTIYLSSHLKEKREKITVLIHELGHIYVWRLPQHIFMAFDQEKLVDTSCMFLGLGALYLNGMTDNLKVLPDGGYRSEQKTFGYLQPKQFGYLLARYCVDHNISGKTLKPLLSSSGWKQYKVGNTYLKKKTQLIHVPKPIRYAQSAIRKFFGMLHIKTSESFIIR